MVTSSPPTSAPGTDKTGMDFRRILPEIRCQSCLSPGSEPTPRGGFSNLLGWAFGPRNFMKDAVSLRRFPDVRGGFSPLLGWAFGPRNFMKNAVSLRRFPDVRGGFSPLCPVASERVTGDVGTYRNWNYIQKPSQSDSPASTRRRCMNPRDIAGW